MIRRAEYALSSKTVKIWKKGFTAVVSIFRSSVSALTTASRLPEKVKRGLRFSRSGMQRWEEVKTGKRVRRKEGDSLSTDELNEDIVVFVVV